MRPDGRRMTLRDWDNSQSRAIGVFLNGDELRTETRSAKRSGTTRSWCSSTPSSRTSPSACRPPARTALVPVLRTGRFEGDRLAPGAEVTVEARSLVVLRRV